MDAAEHQVLLATDVVAMGRTMVPPLAEEWTGICQTAEAHILLFPRTTFEVRTDSRSIGSFVPNPRAVLVTAGEPRPYRRRLVDPRGEITHWYWVSPQVRSDVESLAGPVAHRTGMWLPHPRLLLQERTLALRARSTKDPLVLEERGVALIRAVLGGRDCHRRLLHGSATLQGHRESVARAIAKMAEGIEADTYHSLGELADEACVSPCHFCVVFSEIVGMPASRFQRELRLAASIDRLMERGRDLTSIALELGFSSHSHFTARFKAIFGMTPSQARRLLADAIESRDRDSL